MATLTGEPAPARPAYVRVCPVCDTANPPERARCVCGASLAGVDFSLLVPPVPDAGVARAGNDAPEAPAQAGETSPAPASPAAAEVPEFGVALGNGGSGPGGVAVPVGDPGGAPGGGGKREKVESKTRKLEAKAKPADDGCSEAEVKPSPLELPQPAYTESARAAGIVGKVRVQLTVAVDGSVQAATVVSSLDPGLDAAALAAVKSAKFRPATRCGRPVAATITIGIKFSL